MKVKNVSATKFRGKTPQALLDFLQEVQKAQKEGWQLPKKVSVKDFPNFMNGYNVNMYMEDLSNLTPDELVLEKLKDPSLNKQSLQDLAEEEGLEYPEDDKFPASIRKKLKSQVENKIKESK